MFKALAKALAQLGDTPIQKTIFQTLIVAMIVFIILWSAIGYGLTNTSLFTIGWLEDIIDIMGGLAVLVITWMLFPGVISATMGFFLDTIARAVEAKHYPHLEPAVGVSTAEAIFSSIKFIAILVVLNIFMLLFLIVPPVFPFVFYGVNGYLLGREYFELVALRRMSPAQAKELRLKNKRKILIFGILIALLLSIPLINLLTPIIATAAMLHMFESFRNEA